MSVEGNRVILGHNEVINSGGTAQVTFALPGVTSSAYLHQLKINAPGVNANTAVYGYDGTSGTSALMFLGGNGSNAGSPVPLAAQPDEGFCFEGKGSRLEITNGSVTIEFLNNAVNTKSVYIAGEFTV